MRYLIIKNRKEAEQMKRKTKNKIKDYLKLLLLNGIITTLWIIASYISNLF